jgi:hypothetical protein
MSKLKEMFTMEQSIAQEAEIRLMERINQSIKDRQRKHSSWRLWAKALGEKASECDKESDKVAIIRTIVIGCNFITCLFIIAGIIKHW